MPSLNQKRLIRRQFFNRQERKIRDLFDLALEKDVNSEEELTSLISNSKFGIDPASIVLFVQILIKLIELWRTFNNDNRSFESIGAEDDGLD